MLTDIQIAQSAHMLPICEVAKKAGILEEELYQYGPYKAKLTDALKKRVVDKPNGKLVLVTAINPTPAGEGKTTTTVGLGQALSKLNKNAIIALREPSLGPVMGIKGGAAGGGYSQVVPMEDTICILRAICTRLLLRTTFFPQWWTTISIKAMNWG